MNVIISMIIIVILDIIIPPGVADGPADDRVVEDAQGARAPGVHNGREELRADQVRHVAHADVRVEKRGASSAGQTTVPGGRLERGDVVPPDGVRLVEGQDLGARAHLICIYIYIYII